MRYTVRPISDRTWLGSMGKEPTRFKAKWASTLELLDTEIGALRGRDVVLEIDIQETDLKLNGELRANARPGSSAVVLAFESKHGPLLYRCDRFVTSYYDQGPEWQHNVRAIALTLEALRAVDRYGATETGQQYAGFKAIGGGSSTATAMPAGMTRRTAAELIERIAIGDEGDARERSIQVLLSEPERLREAVRYARAGAHPDRNGGDHDLAYRVDEAARVLGVTR